MTGYTRVVVIGGGFAGVMAANRLMQRDDVSVTVVNPRPDFVVRPRLHHLVAGSHEAVVDYREVLHERVQLVQDAVTVIDATERRVVLAEIGALGYDYLVYAVGSASAEPPVSGMAEFAYPMATIEAAQRLRSIIGESPAGAAVTVVGAGPTGIETAAELAGRGHRVSLVCGGTLGAYLHPRARRAAARSLARLGVTVLDGPGTEVTAVTRDAVRLRDDRVLPSAITVWAAGFGVPDLAVRSGLRTDSIGRLLTDETLTSIDDDRIVAAGDSTAPSGVPYRMSAYTAGCLGAHAADTLLRRMAGLRPEPASVFFNAMCVGLGPQAGIYQLAGRDDTAMRLFIGGRLGGRLKALTYKFGVGHLTNEARKPGSHRWLPNNKRGQLVQAQANRDPGVARQSA
ncbi:FAD-dependent oxidoreductase [Micromonospora sp. AMSO1212t]|uniref:NADH dehydrogenase, FAD-containing subunit n=1 Tax=Micromonospora tulbaghiae TaxID=479978 RepID=A0ABY0KNL2_9ACTN|nr:MULTISPECIES: FAD-dependent oxidoreductase [Micromonospora]KAB1908024.1 FAD-dependent oxidoreductase [Micromonospora sp. AMSO1212t]MDX5457586.1 FAD-dependent oxidoreductase [Micromonospora tulbaghiae]SCE94164.1 NADH dehydrogenase, FAD-containing subunit [Micromonospora tulbaghiae]